MGIKFERQCALMLMSLPCKAEAIAFRTLIEHCCKTGISMAGIGEYILTASFLSGPRIQNQFWRFADWKNHGSVSVPSLPELAGRGIDTGWSWSRQPKTAIRWWE